MLPDPSSGEPSSGEPASGEPSSGPEPSAEGRNEISCATQAAPFFDKPKGYTSPKSKLLLVNGQHKPTLTIKADTWVRLRLGLIASKDYL